MKIARFEALIEQVDFDHTVKQSTIEADVFRYWERKWHDRNSDVVTDPIVTDYLSRARKLDKPQGHGAVNYYPIKKFDAVVRCKTKTSPREKTKNKIFDAILKCAERAGDKYDANHTSLTGLINRNNFNNIAKTEIKYAKERIDGGAGNYEISTSSNISIISIDIDKFKQINDTFTHQYGDVVLKSVASRIEDACASFSQKSGNDTKIVCAHPSGEEFLVLVANSPDKNESMDLAEHLRKVINSTPLPSEKEWPIMSRDVLSDDFVFPDVSHRNVSISLGVSMFAHSEANMSDAEIVAKMLGRADVALQRSKAAGRNRATNFTDILGSHGRVIEYYPETGVVSIDIGSNVGVPYRQEFWVYEKRFYNQDDVYINDGRTSRKIGKFPKKACGRIVVFDVQNEISFCTVEKRHGTDGFYPGNVIIPVQIGAIGHVFYQNHDEDMFDHDMISFERFKELCDQKYNDDYSVYLKNSSKKGTYVHVGENKNESCNLGDTAVVSVCLSNVSEISARRGTSYVNKALAAIYEKIREYFGDQSIISQFDEKTFCILLDCYKNEGNKIEEMIKNISKSFRENLNISFGMCSRSIFIRDKLIVSNGSLLSIMAAYTSLFAGKKKKIYQEFSAHLCGSILNAMLRAPTGEFEVMYAIVKEIGAEDPHCVNQNGLYLWRQGKIDDAYEVLQEALKRALEKKPDLRKNYDAQVSILTIALCDFSKSHYDEAFKSFDNAFDANENLIGYRAYASVAAMSYYKVYRKNPKIVNFDRMKKLFNVEGGFFKPMNINIPQSEYESAKFRINSV